MESSYGIGVKNRYAVFFSDEDIDDPIELVVKTETKKTADKQPANRPVKALNDSKLSNTNHQNIIKDKKEPLIKSKTGDGQHSLSKSKDIGAKGDANRINRPKTDRNQRPPRDVVQSGEKVNHISDRQNRPPRQFNDQKDIDELKNQRNREQHFGGNTDMRERRERSDSDRRGGRNGRVSGPRRGGGRFPDDQRRGKRDLDRHSGSDKAGVKAVDKRDGGGAHNWGKMSDYPNEEQITADNHEMTDRSADEAGLEASEPNPETDTTAAENQEPAIEVPKEMTLEEYKKELEEHRVQPKFNLRKAGEGEDNSQWKKTFVLKKKVEDEEEVEYEEIEVEEDPRKGRHKQVLDIEINFRDEGRDFARRGDGRRGGRGGGLGRDRGGERSDRGDRPPRPDRGDNRGPPRGGAGRPDGGERGDRGERGERAERGDRGERGERSFSDRAFGPRPRRGRGEQAAPKVDDWNDFPSLSA